MVAEAQEDREQSLPVDDDADQGASDGTVLREQVRRIGTWIIALAGVRLFFIGDSCYRTFTDISPTGEISSSVIAQIIRAHSPITTLSLVWPLVLGVMVWRSGTRRYLWIAAVSLGALSLGGIISSLITGFWGSGAMIPVGSISVSRIDLTRLNPSEMLQTAIGGIQLFLELATAVAAFQLAWSGPRIPASKTRPVVVAPRQVIASRLTFLATFAFLLVSLQPPLWAGFLVYLNRSPTLMGMLIGSDRWPAIMDPRPSLVTNLGPNSEWDLPNRFRKAMRLSAANNVAEATEVYQSIIKTLEASKVAWNPRQFSYELAMAFNNMAWMFATCSDPAQRKPEDAVKYAKRAVELTPGDGNYWNTLGAAYFRAGKLDEALDAFEESMELRADTSGDSFDWFFLAMIHKQREQNALAREWYDKATKWFHAYRPQDAELYQFQTEAAGLLGLARPERPILNEFIEPRPIRFGPGPRKGMRSGEQVHVNQGEGEP